MIERYQVEKKYEDAGCINYKLRDANDLKNIIGLDLEEANYWDELSAENKALTEKALLSYLNGCGLMYREGYRINKAYICQELHLVYTNEDGDRYEIGTMFLNVNNPTNIRVEYLNIDNEYKEHQKSATWETRSCNSQSVFLRIDLTNKNGRKEWFHVYEKDGEIEFY